MSILNGMNNEQQKVLRLGFNEGLEVGVFANPAIRADQMQYIMECMMYGMKASEVRVCVEALQIN